MSLTIHQQYGRIGLDIKAPAIRLTITNPQVVLSTTKPELQMHREPPRVQIDQTICFADMNLRNPVDFSQYMFDENKSITLEAIGQIAQEGDYLAQIQNKTSIADIARNNTYQFVEYNVGLVPEHKPAIDFIINPVQINYQPGDVNTNLARGDVNLDLDWGKVSVYMQQYSQISINYTGQHLDTTA